MLKNDQIQPKAPTNTWLETLPEVPLWAYFAQADVQDNQMSPAIKFSLPWAVCYTAAADSEYNLSITGGFDLLCEITFPATITVDTFLRVRIRRSNSCLEFVSLSIIHSNHRML